MGRLADMVTRRVTRLVREGRYVADVEIDLLDNGHEWAPYLSTQDVRKLDEVRLALRRGDLGAAARLARIYELRPIEGE